MQNYRPYSFTSLTISTLNLTYFKNLTIHLIKIKTSRSFYDESKSLHLYYQEMKRMIHPAGTSKS